MQQLPDKPSKLIRLALKDEDKANRSPRYKMHMNVWHEVYTFDRKELCHVCFAGAVMAFTLGAKWKDDLEPEDFRNGNVEKLNALDAFRSGDIYEGCAEMKLIGQTRKANIFDAEEFHPNFSADIADYEEDRLDWRKSMFTIASRFADGGL